METENKVILGIFLTIMLIILIGLVSGMHENAMMHNAIVNGADPIEVGCAYGGVSVETCEEIVENRYNLNINQSN